MEIVRAGSRQPRPGPPEWFTGSVSLDPLVQAPAPARVNSARVTFQPRARTHWHHHPFGQALLIEAGSALIGHADGTVRRAGPGDVVWFDADERHWHGATADAAMTHVAIQEAGADGNATSWAEPVSEQQYAAPPADG